MLKVRRDQAGNRHISVFGGAVQIVELREGARFRVSVGETTLEVPANVADLSWQRDCGRIEFLLTNVSCLGHGKQPVWMIRFKKVATKDGWKLPKPQIRVWVSVVIPVSEEIKPFYVQSCALPEGERSIESYFGDDFWQADVIGRMRHEAKRSHYNLRQMLRNPLAWLLLLLMVAMLPFALLSLGVVLLFALAFTGLFGAIAALVTFWDRFSGKRWQ